MAYEWPNYDPTLEALLHPERRHPYGLHKQGDGWPAEAVCAEFARLAYFRFESEAGQRQLADALAQAGFGAPKTFVPKIPQVGNPLKRIRQWLRDPDAQAFAATSLDGELTILAFRGTQADRLRDLLTDLWAWRETLSGGRKVHKGFWNAYRSLADEIQAWLGTAQPKRLVVTGHSLGAAMATLMAADHPRSELVTFGCPLVGNEKFGRAFGRKALRYVDCTDMVTTVPYGFLGYAHFGELRYIDRDGKVHVSPTADAMKQDQARGRDEYHSAHAGVGGNVPVRNFADHAPVNYVSAVAGLR